MAAIDDPLFAPPPKEVPLPRAPLVRVVSQIRFPRIVSISKEDFIASFQEAIREKYPVLRQEQTQEITVGSEGGVSSMSERLWRFSDIDEKWKGTLTSTFLALEAKAYTSRDDFLTRLRELVTAAQDHLSPKLADRVGLRYIDRVTGSEFADIARLVRPEMLGLLGTKASEHVEISVNQTQFTLPESNVLMRWGRLPKNATHDPNALEPINEPSWILDLDVFTKERMTFDAQAIMTKCQTFAERVYTLFRWAVTDEFLLRYGGKP